MIRMREHVDGLDLLDAVAALCEKMQVARERFGVAGDVDDALRRERDGRGEKRPIAARARRVHQEHVAVLAVLRHIHHKFARVGADEADVFHVVQLGVRDGVAHGVPVYLDAEHLPGGFGDDHANRADAAVRVDDRLAAGEACKFHCLAVENLGLHRVDLVEGLRRNAEFQPAEHVRDEAGAEKRLFVRAEQHRGEAVVHVLHDGRDLRVQLQKRAQEVAARGENRRAGHEHDHDLVGRKAALDEHVPQKAAAGHLVVGRHFEVCEQLADVCDDLIRGLVLGHAAVHGDDVVRAALVDAGDDAARARRAERGLHLVAVVVRAFHADDRLHMRELPEQLYAEAVFPFELFRIGQVLKLAAAALFAVRAAFVFVLRGHGGRLPFSV